MFTNPRGALQIIKSHHRSSNERRFEPLHEFGGSLVVVPLKHARIGVPRDVTDLAVAQGCAFKQAAGGFVAEVMQSQVRGIGLLPPTEN